MDREKSPYDVSEGTNTKDYWLATLRYLTLSYAYIYTNSNHILYNHGSNLPRSRAFSKPRARNNKVGKVDIQSRGMRWCFGGHCGFWQYDWDTMFIS